MFDQCTIVVCPFTFQGTQGALKRIPSALLKLLNFGIAALMRIINVVLEL